MPSREYKDLRKSIALLKTQFLNFEKRVDGDYTRYELMQCRAFIAFCHAEVEIYLEEMSNKTVERAERHWKRFDKTTNAISAMLAYRKSGDIPLPDSPEDQGRKNKLDSLIGSAIAAQKGAIKSNHGIKPKNLTQLFIPIGLKPDQFDASLLIQLKNLGERRGDQVHLSSHVSLPSIRDPFDDELKDIEFLISEIEPFDSLLSALK